MHPLMKKKKAFDEFDADLAELNMFFFFRIVFRLFGLGREVCALPSANCIHFVLLMLPCGYLQYLCVIYMCLF